MTRGWGADESPEEKREREQAAAETRRNRQAHPGPLARFLRRLLEALAH